MLRITTADLLAHGKAMARWVLLVTLSSAMLAGCGGSGSGVIGGSKGSAAGTLNWSAAQLIESNNAGDAGYTDIAVNSSGNAVAVWMQDDGVDINIWANRYVASNGWQTAELIETISGDASLPQVAIDVNGNAVAVWSQQVGTTDSIYANRYVIGSGWQGELKISNTTNAGNAYDPQVTIDAAGIATAVWQQDDTTTGTYRVFASRYTSSWQGPVAINSTVGDASVPEAIADTNGNVTAVWAQDDGTYYSLYTSRYVAGTGWTNAQLIEINVGDVDVPHLSGNANGTVMVVWPQTNGAVYSIWSNRYVVGSGWETAQVIESGANDADVPQVTLDASNNATAVWKQSDGTRYNIWANRYTSGTGWGSAQLIETANEGNADLPWVTADSNGNAIAVWAQNNGTTDNIYSSRYVAGGSWGSAQLVETATGNAGAPQVVVDANGGIMAVWEQYDGTAYSIWSNRSN